MKNIKKGISLIVLVITIIIIIVLAGAVILNIANNNPIENASEAKIASDIDTFRSELILYIGSQYAKDRTFDVSSLEGLTGSALEDVLPSMKDQKIGNKNYSEVLTISNGQVVLLYDDELPTGFDKASKITLTKTLNDERGTILPQVTASMIKEDTTENADSTINKYIGKEVTYSGYSDNLELKWLVYGVDPNTNKILLTADRPVYLNSVTNLPDGITKNSFALSSSVGRDALINFLLDKNAWSAFAVNGKTSAYGAPTIEQFVASYKLRYPDKYFIAKYLSEGQSSGDGGILSADTDGWVLKYSSGTEDEQKYSAYKTMGVDDELYKTTKGFSYQYKSVVTDDGNGNILVSPGISGSISFTMPGPKVMELIASKSIYEDKLMTVYSDTNYIGRTTNGSEYTYEYVRLIISLDNAKIVEKDGKYIVK